MPTLTEQVNSAVASLQTELTETQSLNGKLDEFINGGPTDTVTTTGGTFPCLNKMVADFLAKNYSGGEYAESTFYAGGKMVYYSNALYLATQDFTSSSTGTVANSLAADVASGDLDLVANFQPAVDAAAASAAAALTSENNAATSETNAAASAASAAASAALLTPDGVTLESSGGNLRIKDTGVGFPKLGCALDDDTMATASNTTVPTSESVKAYVDDNGITQTSGTAPYYGVRAFGAFDGSTTPPTIISSGNVTSVARIATGTFEITLTTAMPNGINYCVTTNEDHHITVTYETNTTVSRQSSSVFRLSTGGASGLYNCRYVGFMVMA